MDTTPTDNPQPKETEKSFFSIVVHSFFIIPFLIVVFCVLLFTAIRLLTQERQSPYQLLEQVKTGGLTKRWQAAFELSKILATHVSIPDAQRFNDELIALYKQSEHDDSRVRQYLALAMGRTENPIFFEPLTQNLNDEKDENLYAVIYALGMLKDPRGVKVLMPFVSHSNARLRSAAVVSIGNIGGPESLQILKVALNDTEANVQWGAAISLALMGDGAGENVLEKLLDRKYLAGFSEVDQTEQTNLMISAIEASTHVNSHGLKEKIKELSENDPNMKIRSEALEALRK